MSKKKGKAAAKAAPKNKKMMKPAPRRTAPRSRTTSTSTGTSATTGGTTEITIFLFRTGSGNKIRTAPQRAYVNPDGYLEWTVVNMIDGTDVPVRLTWPEGSPFSKESSEFKGWQRESVAGVRPGRYKYVVHALDAIEDPEIEIPDI